MLSGENLVFLAECEDVLPDIPGHAPRSPTPPLTPPGNRLDIELPALPECHPGDPNIGQECVLVEKEERMVLEYEIEFPKPLKIDEKPTLPGSGSSGELP